MTEFCPFCQTDETRVFLRLSQVQALWDGFPVSEGHALIVPYRHIPTLFEARPDERAELFNSIELVCSHIREKFGADGCRAQQEPQSPITTNVTVIIRDSLWLKNSNTVCSQTAEVT